MLARTARAAFLPVRAVLTLALVFVAAFSLVLAGPGQPGAYALATPPPKPLTLPSSVAADLGLTEATVGTAAEGGAGAAAAGGVAAAGAPVAVAVGGFALGWSVGSFICSGFSWCSGDGTAYVPAPGFTPNTDAKDPGGWSPDSAESNGCVQNAAGYAVGTCTGTLKITGTIPAYRDPAPASTSWSIGSQSFPFSAHGQYTVATQPYQVDLTSGAVTAVPNANDYHLCSQDSGGGCTLNYGRSLVMGTNAGFDHLEFSISDTYTSGSTTSATSKVYKWYPLTHPQRPPAITDPDRFFRTIGSCVKGADVQSVTVDSANFRESSTTYPKYPNVTCPSGYQLQDVSVHKITPALSEDSEVYHHTLPASFKALPTNYPDCAGGTCVLKLWAVQQSGPRLDCFANAEACADWATDPNRSTNYQCTYGSYDVALSECYALGPTFRRIAKLNTGDLPKTDPATGTEVDANGDPYPPPYSAPGVDPAGDPSGQPASDTCPPKFGVLSVLDPFWYYQMTTCAFKWAFVPSDAALSADFNGLRSDWDSSPMGQLVTVVSNVGGAFNTDTTSTGCHGYGLPLDWIDDRLAGVEYHPFESCDGIPKVLADWVSPILVAVLWLSALFTSYITVAAGFGLNEQGQG